MNKENKIIIISNPVLIKSELRKIVELFEAGLTQFHIRKPGFSDFDMINFISQIPKKYHCYLVLHSHYHLTKDFSVKGIQVGKNRLSEGLQYKNEFKYFGYSAHSFEEILELKQDFTHFFISPVFNSISKENYRSNFDIDELSGFINTNSDIKLIALGGIDKESIDKIKNVGFNKFALLGTIWLSDNVVKPFQVINNELEKRTFALSIAGFDPSSGAGITADIKTFEQHKVIGLGVITSITYQNEIDFEGVDWLSFEQIEKQITVLFNKYKIDFVKIGLIENFDTLLKVIIFLKSLNDVIIIWDPILKASAGFEFHKTINRQQLIKLLQRVHLITPNLLEAEQLFGSNKVSDLQQEIKSNNLCNILLKGGHSNNKAIDVLISEKEIIEFVVEKIMTKDKHGTGCILSSAICANLSLGNTLNVSVKNAKKYITKLINSNNSLLAYHNI